MPPDLECKNDCLRSNRKVIKTLLKDKSYICDSPIEKRTPMASTTYLRSGCGSRVLDTCHCESCLDNSVDEEATLFAKKFGKSLKLNKGTCKNLH